MRNDKRCDIHIHHNRSWGKESAGVIRIMAGVGDAQGAVASSLPHKSSYFGHDEI